MDFFALALICMLIVATLAMIGYSAYSLLVGNKKVAH